MRSVLAAKRLARLLIILVCCSTQLQALATTNLHKTRAAIMQVNHHIAQVQKTLSCTQTQELDLQQQLKMNETDIGKISQALTALNAQLTSTQAAIQTIKTNQQSNLDQLQAQQQKLAQQIRLIYQLGQDQTVKAFINPDNIHTTNRLLAYYHYFNGARAKLMTQIHFTMAILDKNMATLTSQEHDLQILLAQKQQRQAQLKQAQIQRQQVLANLHKRAHSKQQELTLLVSNRKALETTLALLQNEKVKEITLPFKLQQGRLLWPVKGGQASTNHLEGVVIKAPEGAPVRAIYTGRVIFANWLRGFGLLLIVNHGNGYMSLYGRNHALYAKIGDLVKPGDVIATIGNSGGFSQSSLYFEIRHDGIPQDPHRWCSA